MSETWLLLPDFALIVLGFVICRATALGRPVWDGVERLVYYVLFPALLFNAIVRNPVQLGTALPIGLSALGTVALGVVLAQALRFVPGVDARLHASGAQTAFRFNSYVALAMAERLAGTQGLAWMALLVSLCVPLCNVAAVWPLARHGGHGYLRELARNPLLLATLGGLLFNVASLRLPELASITLSRMGAAALPLGLMAVGAGLQVGALREAPALAAAFMAIKHLAMPLAALLVVQLLALPIEQQAVVVAFAAMPTSASSYVLAVRMGGHGGFVAGLVSLSTLIAMALLPATLVVLRSVQ
jgi:predicted permease